MNENIHRVEHEVRETLQSGEDIYERVRRITLKALTERELDIDNITKVVEAAVTGISSAFTSQSQPAREAFRQSVDAVDDALEKTAQASKLAIEEAAYRMKDFSDQDIDRATEELKSLEDMFLETLEKVTRESNATVADIARDFITHARRNGTAVGRQIQTTLTGLNKLRKSGQEAVLSGAAATTSTLAKIAGGFLLGIAESLNAEKPKSS